LIGQKKKKKKKVRDIQKAGGTIRKIRTFRNCFTGSEGVDWIARETKLDRLDVIIYFILVLLFIFFFKKKNE